MENIKFLSINEIPTIAGKQICGQYRVKSMSRCISNDTWCYGFITLEDESGFINALWEGEEGTICVEDEVKVMGKTFEYQEEIILDITEICRVNNRLSIETSKVMKSLSIAEVVDEVDVRQLQNIIDQVQTPALKSFVEQVFEDVSFVKAFTTISASKNHHHDYRGGLFKHSLECAQLIINQFPEPSIHRDLSVVGALLHDSGKVWFYLDPKISTSSKYLLHHDLMTTTVLHQPLAKLRETWPDGETALIYIWTWQLGYRKPQYPALFEAGLVQQADRTSALASCHQKAFDGQKKWKQFSNVDTTDSASTRCWRPKPPKK